MRTLGHKLAFGWGFFFGIFCMMIALIGNGFYVQAGAQVIVVIVNVVLMTSAWLQCAKENRELNQ